MVKEIIVGVFLFVFICCNEKRPRSFIPMNLDEKIIGDWSVKKINDSTLELRKFNKDIDDSCFVYRFNKPNKFTWFFFIKHPSGPPCGNTLKSIDVLSSWSVDTIQGLIIIDNVQTISIHQVRNKTRYFVFEYKPGSLTFITDKILLEEEK